MIRGLFAIFFALTLFIFPYRLIHAEDGSGTANLTPDAVTTNSTDNFITVTYRATEMLWDGLVKFTIPDEFSPDPDGGNTSVSVTDGFLATLLDDMETNPLSPPWESNVEVLGLIDIPGMIMADTSADRWQGDQSLSAEFLVTLALPGSIANTSVYKNLPVAEDWSEFERLSFWIKLEGFLLADIAILAQNNAFVLATGVDLGGTLTTYGFDETAFIDIDLQLLADGQWAHVVIDLTRDGNPPSTLNNVRSFGVRSDTGVLPAGTDLFSAVNLDYFTLGDDVMGDIEYMGKMVTVPLTNLNANGTVTLNYTGDAPATEGSFPFDVASKMDSGYMGNLTPIQDSPTLGVIDISDPNNPNNKGQDVDGDGVDEIAARVDVAEPCYDFFLDPGGSVISTLFVKIDGNQDGCLDFFLDTDQSNLCPEIYWDATNMFFGPVTQTTLEINGVETQVCAYDSTGDGENDSYILPDADEPGLGGEGAGQANPFAVSGSGCGISPTSVLVSKNLWLVGLLWAGLAAGWLRRRIQV